MNYLFSRLSGFNADSLEFLPKKIAQNIELLSFWAFLSIFLCCLSVSYIVQITTKIWILSIGSFLFLFFVLHLIQSLLVTSSFIELETSSKDIYKWKPTKVRVIIFIFIGLLFSQPLIFFYKSLNSELKTNVSITKLENVENNMEERIDFYESDKKLAIVQKKNYIGLINGDLNTLVVSNEKKKALILFNEASIASEDILAKKLESIGFKVTKLANVDKDHFNLVLKQYSDTLKPGDVSLIFFVGRYKEHQGKFYLLPTNFNSDINETVDLHSYASSLNRRKLFGSLFFINFVEDKSSYFTTDITKFQAIPDSLIFIKYGVADKKGLDSLIGRFLEKLSSSGRVDHMFSTFSQSFSNNSIILINKLRQPIYLNITKESQSLTEDEVSKILPAQEYCSNFSNAGKKYLTGCLNAQITIIQDGIDFLENVKKSEIEKIERLKKIKKEHPSLLLNYFGNFTENIPQFFIYTSIAIFLISGGFLFRDKSRNSVNLYEQLNYKKNKIKVLLDFKKFRITAKRMRINFMGTKEKVAISDFPIPFNPPVKDYINIDKSKNASEDFFDLLKRELSSHPKGI